MAKNIVICSDGTGNTFSKRVSNITHLIKSLELSDPDTQVVIYDQGLGTNPKLVEKVREYKFERGTNRKGLEFPLQPKTVKSLVMRPFFRFFGLLFGYGLRENVKELYKALAERYDESDQIFLFGFSRGAFTVRVLAGLIYRCGLPPKNVANSDKGFDKCFSEAYEIYKPHHKDSNLIKKFKKDYQVRDCEIRFLGIWDTVKSYGGIWPQSLPHLRHNPIVNSIRHAVALNERRSWFVPTSWGWLDIDEKNSQSIEPDPRYDDQRKNIKEVWFRGCHSDVGGGDEEEETARIPLRWMLKEAPKREGVSKCGLILNQDGQQELSEQELLELDSQKLAKIYESLKIHESLKKWWYVAEYIPRWELDNKYRPPKRLFKCGRTGERCVANFNRNGKMLLHSSVRDSYSLKSEYID